MIQDTKITKNRDIHFTDKQGNEYFVMVREERVEVWRNKEQIQDVRFYDEELTKECKIEIKNKIIMNDKAQQIENLLFERFNTSFDASFNDFSWEIFPNDTIKLAQNLEVDVNSDDFTEEVDKIEVAINTLF